MEILWTGLKKLYRHQTGAELTEYGLVIGLVAVGLIATLIALRDKLITVFNDIIGTL